MLFVKNVSERNKYMTSRLKRLVSFTISGSYRKLAKILKRLGKHQFIAYHRTLKGTGIAVNFLNTMG